MGYSSNVDFHREKPSRFKYGLALIKVPLNKHVLVIIKLHNVYVTTLMYNTELEKGYMLISHKVGTLLQSIIDLSFACTINFPKKLDWPIPETDQKIDNG